MEWNLTVDRPPRGLNSFGGARSLSLSLFSPSDAVLEKKAGQRFRNVLQLAVWWGCEGLEPKARVEGSHSLGRCGASVQISKPGQETAQRLFLLPYFFVTCVKMKLPHRCHLVFTFTVMCVSSFDSELEGVLLPSPSLFPLKKGEKQWKNEI